MLGFVHTVQGGGTAEINGYTTDASDAVDFIFFDGKWAGSFNVFIRRRIEKRCTHRHIYF